MCPLATRPVHRMGGIRRDQRRANLAGSVLGLLTREGGDDEAAVAGGQCEGADAASGTQRRG